MNNEQNRHATATAKCAKPTRCAPPKPEPRREATTVPMPKPESYNDDGYVVVSYTTVQMQAYGDARAEEARREGLREGLADRLIGEVKREVVLEDEIEELKKQFAAAQRTAGGDAAVIEMLLGVARAAWTAMDNAEERPGPGEDAEYVIQGEDFTLLNDAMNRLDALPDQPGHVMDPPAKARWALESHVATLAQRPPARQRREHGPPERRRQQVCSSKARATYR